jgi:hypothetical protein
MSRSRLDGSPYTQEAISPSRARGSASTNTGTPLAAARLRPAGSVSTATAPAATASAQNAAPCTRAPGRATYRSPGFTDRESCVRPERNPSSFGIIGVFAVTSLTPSSVLSADSGRRGRVSGRIATG